jgi:Kef-type K+ transport system membrane component KefB
MFSEFSQVLENDFFILLFIMVVIWSVGTCLEKIKVPLIIGELLAGVVIGPACLNLVHFTPEIETMAQLGMFFLMFYAGLKNDPRRMKKIIGHSIIIGVLGNIVPFAMGIGVVLWSGGTIYQAILIGAAISVTSLITKTRILGDLGILKSRLGNSMTGAAILDNIFAFIILVIVMKAFAEDSLTALDVVFTALEIVTFFSITLFIGHVIFPKMSRFFSCRSGKGFTFAMVMGLLFAVLAEAINLPFILGAYIAGLFVREEIMSAELYQKMDDRFLAIANGFLGPIFIMSVAFHVSFDIFLDHPMFVLGLTAAAFIGKFLGVYLGGRISGFKNIEATSMGLGMNGRGAVELVFAAVGVELGILNNMHLSALVFVAFFTTFITPFLLKLVKNK